MHCDCCDCLLTDYESSIKGCISGEYLNTCRKCLRDLGIPWKGNHALLQSKDNVEEIDIEYVPMDSFIDLIDLEDE